MKIRLSIVALTLASLTASCGGSDRSGESNLAQAQNERLEPLSEQTWRTISATLVNWQPRQALLDDIDHICRSWNFFWGSAAPATYKGHLVSSQLIVRDITKKFQDAIAELERRPGREAAHACLVGLHHAHKALITDGLIARLATPRENGPEGRITVNDCKAMGATLRAAQNAKNKIFDGGPLLEGGHLVERLTAPCRTP